MWGVTITVCACSLGLEGSGKEIHRGRMAEAGTGLSAAAGKVCEDFEVRPCRHAATSYEDFVQALREVIERHMGQNRSDEARKNP